jgi:multiple sugar transport system permease protein
MSTETMSSPVNLRERRRAAAAERTADRDRTRQLLTGGRRGVTIGIWVALVILAAVWLIPFFWAIDTSLKSEQQAQTLPLTWFPDGGFTLANYATVFERGQVPRWMLNTFIVATSVTIIATIACAMAGFAFSRTRFRGRNWLFAGTIALIAIPPQMLMVPLFEEMLALDLVDTWPAIILPQLVVPTMVFIFKRFFDAIPQELEDAARVDGASNWKLFWSIIMPISRPIVTAVAIFVFISAWNNFMWPFIITNNPDLMTLPVGLATIKNSYGVVYAQTMASAMVGAAPLIILFVFFQRHIVKAVATTGLGGQ